MKISLKEFILTIPYHWRATAETDIEEFIIEPNSGISVPIYISQNDYMESYQEQIVQPILNCLV